MAPDRAWGIASVRRHGLVLGIVVFALALRLFAPGPTTETVDEDLWLHRSQVFGTSLVTGDFGRATPLGIEVQRGPIPTMPGVTAMWAGTTGRLVAKTTGKLGLSAPVEVPSWESPQVLRAARAVVSVMVVAALAVIVAAVGRLFGRGVALLTGTILASEPWLVGHGALLHTDALVTFTGAAAVLAAAVGFGAARRRPDDPVTSVAAPRVEMCWVVLSAVCGAAALLTKANALGVVGPGMVAVLLSAGRVRWSTRGEQGSDHPDDLRALAITIAGWVLGAALLCVVLWPAMWVSAADQLAGVWRTISQADLPRPKFFAGTVSTNPGAAFYPVTLAFRLTPWALLLVGVGLVAWLLGMAAAGVTRITGRRGMVRVVTWVPAWVGWSLVPYMAVMATSPNKYDRYFMPVVPLGVIAGAIVAMEAVTNLTGRFTPEGVGARVPRWVAVAGGVLVVGVLSWGSVHLAPYALNYASPLVGGQRAAERWIPLGWGESAAELGAEVTRREHGACDGVRVANLWRLPVSVPCGRPFEPGTVEQLTQADYAVTLIALRQRGTFPWYRAWLVEHATRVDVVEIDGVVYGELWELPR